MNTELIHKYLSGECTTEEEQQMEHWLHASPENQKKMDEIRQIWSVSPGKRIHVDSEKAWRVIRERVAAPRKRSTASGADLQKKQIGFHRRRHGRRGRMIRIMAYTAVAAAVLLAAFLISNERLTSMRMSGSELAMQEITTTKGQRTSVKLSDGTRVQLNADSKLIIPERFSENNRTVTLEGEAYFEIVPDENRKFFVRANHSVTQVLGTKFNVRAYPDEDNVEVVVTEGKVSMFPEEHLSGPEVQLTRNQRGILSKEGKMKASTIADVNAYLDWTKGKLTFRDAPVEEVEARLERWYDIEVILKDDFPAKDPLLTGSFEQVPLSVVLSSIALSLDLHYEQEGNTVFFSKK